MTTHIYKDFEVVSDSQITGNYSRIEDDNFNKVVKYKSLTMFLCGDPSGIEDVLNICMSERPVETFYDVGALVWDSDYKTLYQVGSTEDQKSSKYILDPKKYYAVGSGSSYALGALDVGASAREAMRAAVKRDIMTGGKIRITKLK
jgi:hypothetical protein